MTALYATGAARGMAEQCENCFAPAKYGDTLHVYAIGGGWAHLCNACYLAHEADRRAGQILSDDAPEFTEAEAV